MHFNRTLAKQSKIDNSTLKKKKMTFFIFMSRTMMNAAYNFIFYIYVCAYIAPLTIKLSEYLLKLLRSNSSYAPIYFWIELSSSYKTKKKNKTN